MAKMNDLIFPTFKDLKVQWSWGFVTLEDMQWYVDMGVIDKAEYALITGEKYPETKDEKSQA